MRTIKFRGKNIKTDKWEYGHIREIWASKEEDYRFIICPSMSYEEDGWTDSEEVEIVPKTIGQFTGLTDRNGKDCFEGDIVKMYRHSDVEGKHIPNRMLDEDGYRDEICEVKFIHSSFVVWNELVKNHRAFIYMARPGESFEVIGNIHDNPEFLKRSQT